MTNHEQHNEFESVLELLSEQGFAGMKEAMETLLNETMKLQRSVHELWSRVVSKKLNQATF